MEDMHRKQCESSMEWRDKYFVVQEQLKGKRKVTKSRSTEHPPVNVRQMTPTKECNNIIRNVRCQDNVEEEHNKDAKDAKCVRRVKDDKLSRQLRFVRSRSTVDPKIVDLDTICNKLNGKDDSLQEVQMDVVNCATVAEMQELERQKPPVRPQVPKLPFHIFSQTLPTFQKDRAAAKGSKSTTSAPYSKATKKPQYKRLKSSEQ
eukprot:TRINITY_DN24164_c0_g1_i2.p1 TRINITY_DN24164_c0_g1~~TRINITY_DN24164_c0_g1_i2.p1  ORF type:complete len:204 (+),score=32.92 TRINITY_DN24164_c0_g1_i2:33-644(+)